jgi:hypothetical protein
MGAMASCSSFYFVPLLLLLMLLLASPPATAALASSESSGNATTGTLRPGKELLKHKRIRALLTKLNKPALKTIQVTARNLKLNFDPFFS